MEQSLSTIVAPYQKVNNWAIYAIKEFQAELDKKKIRASGALFNSFKKLLRANRGDVQEVMIKFAMYGRFIDMGVGRGLKAYERKSNKINMMGAKRYGASVSYVGRRPKRWYPKRKAAETYRLSEILIDDMGADIVKWMAEDFNKDVMIHP